MALLFTLTVALALSCSAAQNKDQAAFAAIVAGCKVSLDLDRDAGAAGATDDEERACKSTLRVWETKK